MKKLSFQDEVFIALGLVLKNGKALWSDMMNAVKAAKIKVVNWLDVRGVLQFMINEKLIVRTKNVSKEEYNVIDAAGLQDWISDIQAKKL